MAESIRIFYGREHGLQGRCRMNFNWAPITALSVVSITAAEANDWESAHLMGGQMFSYNLGNANVWVSNVSPHNEGVEFILNVDWEAPLNIAVTITVEDGPLSHFRVE